MSDNNGNDNRPGGASAIAAPIDSISEADLVQLLQLELDKYHYRAFEVKGVRKNGEKGYETVIVLAHRVEIGAGDLSFANYQILTVGQPHITSHFHRVFARGNWTEAQEIPFPTTTGKVN